MKNTKVKWIGGLGLLGLGVVLLSFGHPGDEPKFVRYEVIRSVGGEVMTYDTVLASGTTFTPEQYLAQLGFSNDKNVQVINLPHSHEMTMRYHGDRMHSGDSMKVVRVAVNGEGPVQGHHGQMLILSEGDMPCGDSLRMFHMQMEAEHAEMMDAHQQMMIEKNITIRTIDSLHNETVEIQRLMELVHLDSLMALHHLHGGDSAMVFVHEVVIEDGAEGDQKMQELKWEEMHGEPSFERHVDNGNTQSDLEVFSDKEDFTIVIVSDASVQPKAEVKIERSNVPVGTLKLYPNPASKEVTVQLNFEEKATTTITVTNAEGKVVMQLSLGEFSGQHAETINVSKWSKGIYFVNVERPGTKVVEKLVIE